MEKPGPKEDGVLATATKYSKKQMKAVMEHYSLILLQPHELEKLPFKFKYEISQYGNSITCHLRSTQGLLLEVDELTEWFEKLPEKVQAEVLPD